MNFKRVVIIILSVAVLACISLSWIGGTILIASNHHAVAAAPPDLKPETITLTSRSGVAIKSWVFKQEGDAPAVLILHGVRADRASMLTRAAWLYHCGFSVMVPDLSGHGESGGDKITFGYQESKDAESCLQYLRNRFPKSKIGAIGVSLGGASLCLMDESFQPDALVLEAVYPTITDAVYNRLEMRVGPLSHLMAPLLLLQLKPRLGFGADSLRPVDGIQKRHCPVLIIAGTADRHTTEEQTRVLFRAANEPKDLWLIAGAAHVDLERYDRQEYRSRILRFFEKNLR